MSAGNTKTPSRKRRQSLSAETSPAKAIKANTEESPAVAAAQTPQHTTPRDTVYSHLLPTQEQKKGNGRVVGRSLIMWNRPRIPEKVLLNMVYECARRKIQLPWDAIAHRFHPGSSGAALNQYFNRIRRDLIAEGHVVPPIAQKSNSAAPIDPRIRGYIRKDMDGSDMETTRPVMFDEKIEDRKHNLPDAFNLPHLDTYEFGYDFISPSKGVEEDEGVAFAPATPTPARRTARVAVPAASAPSAPPMHAPAPVAVPIAIPIALPIPASAPAPNRNVQMPQGSIASSSMPHQNNNMAPVSQELSPPSLFVDNSIDCDGHANQSFARVDDRFNQSVHQTQAPQLSQSTQGLPTSQLSGNSYATPKKNTMHTGGYDDSSPDFDSDSSLLLGANPFGSPTRQPIPSATSAPKTKAEQPRVPAHQYDGMAQQAPLPTQYDFTPRQWVPVPMGYPSYAAPVPVMQLPIPNGQNVGIPQALQLPPHVSDPVLVNTFTDFVAHVQQNRMRSYGQQVPQVPDSQIAYLPSSSSSSPLSDHSSVGSIHMAAGEPFVPLMPEGFPPSL